MKKVFFKEKQLFRKTIGFYFLSFFVFGIISIFGIELFQQTWDLETETFINSPDPNFVKTFIVVFLFMFYVFVSAFRLKLEVTIVENGISYKLVPFDRVQIIERKQVDSFRIRKGKDTNDFRGSAFRRIFGIKRKVYVINGKSVMQIYLANGKSILLGTQRPKMFANALERLTQKRG